MAATAASCWRHASAQMIAKPAAMPGIWGARKASAPDSSVNTASGHSRLTSTAAGWTSGSVLVARAPDSRRAIGGLVCARRPSPSPTRVAITHQPRSTATSTVREPEPVVEASSEMAASAVAAPALSSTVVLRKSTKRKTPPLQQGLQQRPYAGRTVDGQVGLARQLGRYFVRADGDANGVRERARGDHLAQPAEGVEVGRVIPDIQGRLHDPAPEQRGDREALVEQHRGADLEHLAPPVHRQAFCLRAPGDLAHGLLGERLVGGPAPVKGGDRVLVLAAHADALVLGRVHT